MDKPPDLTIPFHDSMDISENEIKKINLIQKNLQDILSSVSLKIRLITV